MYSCRLRRAAVLLLAVAACGEDPTRPPPPPPPPPGSVVASVTITPSADSLRPGDSIALTAIVRDTLGNIRTDFEITWSSADSGVARVSATGGVRGLTVGVTEISAKAESVAGHTAISVVAPLDLAGIWDFRALVTDTVRAITCADTGSFVLTPIGNHWEGRADKVGSCPTIQFGTGPLYGFVTGSRVLLSTEETQCYYNGSAAIPVGDTISGTVDCYLSNVYNFSGTWTAKRGAPVSSITMVPEVRRLVPTGTTQLNTIQRDATGNRVFGRSVSWTSDDSAVAMVSNTGLVTALTTGSTTIRASITGATPGAGTVEITPVSFGQLVAGFEFVCGTTANGAACWGDNRRGSLGDGSFANSSTPVPFPSVPRFISIGASASSSHACGITATGATYCWGNNYAGQLGDGSKTDRPIPVLVQGGHVFTTVVTGIEHTCALAADSTAWCWGSNSGTALGHNGPPWPTIQESLTPLLVTDTLKFTFLAAAYLTTCGLTATGDAYCWGAYPVAASWPGKVQGGMSFVSLTVGTGHACGLTTSGQALCWGTGERGQLGLGSTANMATPEPVTGGLTFTSLDAGRESTCGVATGGAAYCWGRNGANLGIGADDPTTNTLAPAPVLGGLTFADLAAGGAVTCGLTPGLVAYCWGWGASGALGNGSTSALSLPVRVSGQP